MIFEKTWHTTTNSIQAKRWRHERQRRLFQHSLLINKLGEERIRKFRLFQMLFQRKFAMQEVDITRSNLPKLILLADILLEEKPFD